MSKLSKQDVLDIRMEYATGQTTQRALAEFFGISKSTVGELVRGEIWNA